jgi:phosphoglycerate dehydrogenase-like enzyme
MNIVIPDKINLPNSAIDAVSKLGNFSHYQDTKNKSQDIILRIKDADIITANFIDITKKIITKSPKLRYIISPASGYDWIDIKSATTNGVKVLNCPTHNSNAVAEHAIGLLFSVTRMISSANNSILNGQYNSAQFTGTELGGKLLVTYGYGRVGKKIIQLAKGLNMKTAFINSSTSKKETSILLKQADFLVMCLPLNQKTQNILGQEQLDLMKKTAYIINVARGLVVDQNALFKALKNKKIAGAGIDTFPQDETIIKPNQNINRFTSLSNVVATPHIAYNTAEASDRLGQELLNVIKSCLEHKPINVVN